MERLKHMGLRQSFFLLSVSCLLAALLLTASIYVCCGKIAERYPHGGISIDPNGMVRELDLPTAGQERILRLLNGIQLFSVVVIPVAGLGMAGLLFYHIKLKTPILVLRAGTERIRNHDLDFSVSEVSDDELGQICAAFETMRAELLRTNQELWRQTEERKRLNAAFSHDLRNPVTVLKGSVKLLRQGMTDESTLDRLESYTLRIEQYVEAMSSIQRLEHMPVQINGIACTVLQMELKETARLLAPGLCADLVVPEKETGQIDHGIFLTVVENLIGNAARFSKGKLEIILTLEKDMLLLTITDDGPGFPSEILKNGPKPFGKMEESAEHFGMGLYSSSLLCRKHGGELCLKNCPEGGASVMVSFKMNDRL